MLGIEPTRDQAAIRLAYAVRLKVTRPDVDPAAFGTLREAFERARTEANRPQANRPHAVRPHAADPPVADSPSADPPPTRPQPVHVDPVSVGSASIDPASVDPASVDPAVAGPVPDADTLHSPRPKPLPPAVKASKPLALAPTPPIRQHLRAGRLAEAARAWSDAVSASTIGFKDQADLQKQIAVAALKVPALTLAELTEIASLMQWEAVAKEFDADKATVEIMERHAAEAWLAGLQEAASSTPGLLKLARRRQVRGARVLLRPAPGRVRRFFPYLFSNPDVAHWLPAVQRHGRFLAGRLDPARIAWCRASLTRRDARVVVYLFRLYIILALASGPLALCGQLLAWLFPD